MSEYESNNFGILSVCPKAKFGHNCSRPDGWQHWKARMCTCVQHTEPRISCATVECSRKLVYWFACCCLSTNFRKFTLSNIQSQRVMRNFGKHVHSTRLHIRRLTIWLLYGHLFMTCGMTMAIKCPNIIIIFIDSAIGSYIYTRVDINSCLKKKVHSRRISNETRHKITSKYRTKMMRKSVIVVWTSFRFFLVDYFFLCIYPNCGQSQFIYEWAHPSK